jgi:hypothetical protein
MREEFGIRHLALQPDWPRAAPATSRRIIPVEAKADDREPGATTSPPS